MKKRILEIRIKWKLILEYYVGENQGLGAIGRRLLKNGLKDVINTKSKNFYLYTKETQST